MIRHHCTRRHYDKRERFYWTCSMPRGHRGNDHAAYLYDDASDPSLLRASWRHAR
jgi:hypothetical protein